MGGVQAPDQPETGPGLLGHLVQVKLPEIQEVPEGPVLPGELRFIEIPVAPAPDLVQPVDGAVLFLEPPEESRPAVFAEAGELLGDGGPVGAALLRLVPDVPHVQGRVVPVALHRDPQEPLPGLKGFPVAVTDSGEAANLPVAHRGRQDLLPVGQDDEGVGVPFRHPQGRDVEDDVQRHPEAVFVSDVHELVDVVEIEFVLAPVGPPPLDPEFHGVEAQGLHVFQVAFPVFPGEGGGAVVLGPE